MYLILGIAPFLYTEAVAEMSQKWQILKPPDDIIKDPYILEFLGLNPDSSYSKSDLEQRIIDELQNFLMELGKGYTFVGRQVRLTFDEQHFFVDLVFFNRLLQYELVLPDKEALRRILEEKFTDED